MRKYNWFLLLLFTIVLLAPQLSIAKEKLAVMDLKAKFGVEEGLAEGLSVVIRDTIHSFGDYEVLSKEDVEVIAERTAIRQAVGCDDTECLINIGRKLGTKFMVAGAISKFGSTYNVSLRLLETIGKDPGVKKRVNQDCKCAEDELIDTARVIANLLLEKRVGQPASDNSKVSNASKAVREPMQRKLKGGRFPDPILASLEAEHHRIDQRYNLRHKLAIFPWMEIRDSTLYRIYLIDALNKSTEKTEIFVPIFSYYELNNNYNTKVIRNLMTEYPAETLFTTISTEAPKPRIDFICDLGSELKVDAVFTCYSKLRGVHSGGTDGGGSRFDTYIELFLIDIRSTRNHKRVIKGTISDIDLRLLMEKALLELFSEFPKKTNYGE